MDSKRLRNEKLKEKIMTAEEAAKFVKKGMTIGTSGFTPSGYPKAVPLALAERCKNGEELDLTIITGASVGPEIDSELIASGAISRRYPYQTNSTLRKQINSNKISYADMHLSHTPQQVKEGFLGNIDMAIVEAIAIREDGGIVPSTSVGNSSVFVETADMVIVELNTSQPLDLEGCHDIYSLDLPPKRKPIPLTKVDERLGTNYIPCNPDKIVAIVETNILDNTREVAPVDEVSRKMAENLINFLASEVDAGRLPKSLLPLQSGVGSVANAVLSGLENSEFTDLEVYSEVLQDSVLDLIDTGKVGFASATSLTLSPSKMKHFIENIHRYKDKILLRPQEISNNPELIRRLGIIAMNTAIEVDIYGNVNSTHISGTNMMNGIGGSGDFTRNGYLSIFTTSSTAKDGKISSIVPMVSHVDHTEHDVMVIVTEQGVADLRGLTPIERAREIIKNCAHPDYKPMLEDYLNKAINLRGGHTPHILEEAFDPYTRLRETGSMVKGDS